MHKKQLYLTVLFAFLGSASVKAERKHVDEMDSYSRKINFAEMATKYFSSLLTTVKTVRCMVEEPFKPKF